MMRNLYIFFFTVFLSCNTHAGGPFEQVAKWVGLGGGSWLTTIDIKAAKNMNTHDNREDPCRFALVFCNNKDLEKKFLEMNGPDFFKSLDQLKKDHGNDLYVFQVDVVPNDQKTFDVKPKDNPNEQKVYDSAEFVVGYASYQAPGDHRFTVLSGPDKITVNFGPDTVTAIVEQKK